MAFNERDTDNASVGASPIDSLTFCLEDEVKSGIWTAADIAATTAAIIKAATMLRYLQEFVAMVARLTPPDKQEESDPEDSAKALSGLIAMARRLVSENTDG
ncbi:hypothetical protein BMS3Bbin13_00079 [bacterium BMS3Bbin13]|nr:hypothetical protein BMS3Bbin13_00079 [bacterium BMS3Bbin13]